MSDEDQPKVGDRKDYCNLWYNMGYQVPGPISASDIVGRHRDLKERLRMYRNAMIRLGNINVFDGWNNVPEGFPDDLEDCFFSQYTLVEEAQRLVKAVMSGESEDIQIGPLAKAVEEFNKAWKEEGERND